MSLVQPHHPAKIGVIFLGRKRPGFDMEWGRQMEQRVRDLLTRLPIEVFEPSEKVVDDNTLRCAVELFRKQQVDAVAVLQSTMGDGRLAPTLAQLWPEPLLLWATPERPDGEMISSCSLVARMPGRRRCGRWDMASSWFTAIRTVRKRKRVSSTRYDW